MKKLQRSSMIIMSLFIAFTAFMANASSNKIIGLWNWSNASTEYPIYIEFNSDGEMLLHRMKQSGLDTDRYKWNTDGSVIYSTRPDAGQKVVHKLQIIRNDGSTMILHDSTDNSDMWLEKVN